jgi:hypothetical protein
MSSSSWGRGFAVGLVAGVGLAAMFLVWSFPGFRNPTYQQEQFQHSRNSISEEDSPVIRPSFWENYTTPTDTYAQWIMAVFSVAATGVSVWAVWLVRRTLQANADAVEQAKRANDIMQDGQRPWLAIQIPNVSIYSDDGTFPVVYAEVETTNLGKGPALDVKVHVLARFPKIIAFGSAASSAFAAEVSRESLNTGTANTIIFPERSPKLTGISNSVDNSFPLSGSCQLLVCATYRSRDDVRVFHAARAFRFSARNFNELDGQTSIQVSDVAYIKGSDSIA